jgi:RNA polymerase sigma-70 factor (ECF subfamily)
VEEVSDESLVVQVAAGDADACRRLVERHLGRVVAFAARTLGDRTAAEDVAQETFLRLWKHAAEWRPTARLSTWLHRVALNLCLDRGARRREASLDDVPEPQDTSPSMTDLLQQQAIARHVNAAMQTLPHSQRAAIALCHYQGLRNVEAAEVLGVRKSEGESEKLADLLKGDTVDEKAALAQSERVLAAEQEIKQVHLALLIRIKNQLTPAQQKQLRELRKESREHRRPPPPPM